MRPEEHAVKNILIIINVKNRIKYENGYLYIIYILPKKKDISNEKKRP